MCVHKYIFMFTTWKKNLTTVYQIYKNVVLEQQEWGGDKERRKEKKKKRRGEGKGKERRRGEVRL